MQETCNFDCLYAYLTCTNYDFRYDMSKGLRPRRQVRQAMAHEISMYGIVQKEKLGFDKAVEDIKYRMSRYQVTPNVRALPAPTSYSPLQATYLTMSGDRVRSCAIASVLPRRC